MKITTKVKILKLACDGMFEQRSEAQRGAADAIYEFHDEIAEYLKTHLPNHNKIWANSTIVELKLILEALFKDSSSPRRTDLQEYLGKLSSAAHMVPEGSQEV